MADDIVVLLREGQLVEHTSDGHEVRAKHPLADELADEIESLRAQIETLQSEIVWLKVQIGKEDQ